MHAHVYLDQHPQPHPLGLGGLGQGLGVFPVDHRHHHLGVGRQVHQAGDLAGAHHLVGDEDVVYARLGHHLGLAQLGAGDADGSGPKLHPGDSRALVGLGVRAQAGGPIPQVVGHAGDVALQGLGVQA